MGRNRHSSFTKPKAKKPEDTLKSDLPSVTETLQTDLPQDSSGTETALPKEISSDKLSWAKHNTFWGVLGLIASAIAALLPNVASAILFSVALVIIAVSIYRSSLFAIKAQKFRFLAKTSLVILIAAIFCFLWTYFQPNKQKEEITLAQIQTAVETAVGNKLPNASPDQTTQSPTITPPAIVSPTPKQQTFSEGVGAVMFTVGNNKQVEEATNLQNSKRNFFIGDVPAILYFENGKPFIDVDLYAPPDEPPVRLRHNVLESKPSQWDMNSDDTGIEVVDGKERPIFQLNYKSPAHLVMYGVFFNGYVSWLASPEGFRSQPDLDKKPYPIERLFKYPSSKYNGKRIK